MKSLSLRLLSIVAIFAVLFSSCSKDSLSKPSSQVSKHSPNDPGPTVLTGSIHAILSSASALRTSIVVTDDNGFRSDEIFADQNGEVLVTDLPEGTYTVTAHAYIPEGHDDQATDITDLTVVVTDVVVVGDQVTDLGKIIFGQ